jgi:hypothetical protein
MLYQPQGNMWLRQELSNCQAVVTAVSKLEEGIARQLGDEDAQRQIAEFTLMDDKHQRNLRQALRDMGCGPESPDTATVGCIAGLEAIVQASSSPFEKLRAYALLRAAVRDRARVLAHVGAARGDERLEQLMAVNYYEATYEHATVVDWLVRRAADLAITGPGGLQQPWIR